MNEGGDRHSAHELCHGASTFDPFVAKDVSHPGTIALLQKLRHYPVLNKDGNCNIVDRLIQGFRAYRQNANLVVKQFDYKKDPAVILSWHYKLFLRLDDERAEDSGKGGSCRHCGSNPRKCHCNANLRCYWEVTSLLALAMPSSCAAERVFSLLSNKLNDRQARTLGPAIFLSLFLSYNKRS